MKAVLALVVAWALLGVAPSASPVSPVLDTTLANGLHVIIVPNHLAPVVTTSLVYNVGSNDDTIPGIAHATEHMMFRGTPGVSSDQFANIATRIGAEYDATTTSTITRYYFTIPSNYLDVVLRVEADRMQHASMRDTDWSNERGAIEQEVKSHLSNPMLGAMKQVNALFFGDSPWAADPVGTLAGFDKMRASDIAAFYHTWYHPNNALLVIAGEVDPAAALELVKSRFGDIAPATVPAHPPLPLKPLEGAALTQKIDFPIPITMITMRMPGTSDADYAATQVLFQALQSGRGSLADLMLQGKALFAVAQDSAFAQGGFGVFAAATLPGTDPKVAVANLQGVIDGYAKTGIPLELITDAKNGLLASRAYEGTSIPGSAEEWSTAQSIENRTPDQLYAALEAVTPADVNRVFTTYVVQGHSVTLSLLANPSAAMPSADSMNTKENVQVTASDAVRLPQWTDQYFSAQLRAPDVDAPATTLHLKNGMTIVVRPETSSPTFVVHGAIRNNTDLYEAKGREGVSAITSQLLAYGTTTYDFKSYRAQVEAIAAYVELGTSFYAQARLEDFDRTIALLADAQLHPAFATDQFALVSSNTVKSTRALEGRPEYRASIARLYAMYPPNDPHRRHSTSASLAAVTRSDVLKWYAFAYRPDLTTISVVGDVTPDQVRVSFEKYFGGWQSHGPTPSMAYPPVRHTQRTGTSTTIRSSTNKQADVTLTQAFGLRRGNRDVVALDLANTMLSGEGTGSMLFHDVRKQHGYAYSIDSSLNVSESGSTFVLTFASDPKNVNAAQNAASASLERLRKYPPSAADLALAKAMLLSSYTVSLDSYNGVARNLLTSAQDGLDANDVTRFYARVIATTPQDVQRAMDHWIDPKKFTRVIVAPESP